MKKLLTFLLIFLSCGGTELAEEPATTTTTLKEPSTTSTQAAIEYDQTLEEIGGEYCIVYTGEDLINSRGEVFLSRDYVMVCYENKQEAEEDLARRHGVDRYRNNWEENHLVSYPDLTEEEYNKTLLLYNHPISWTGGKDFTTIIDGKEFYCEYKSTGYTLTAFANELHPALKGSHNPYQIDVDYNCGVVNEEEVVHGDGYMLYGPVFYQDNQWWGFVRYSEDYYMRYLEDIEDVGVDAFMTKFVKRISLGDILISEASEETTTTSVASTSQTAPSIVFINCVDTEITGDTYELTYDVIAGNEDMNYYFVSTYKNGEYVNRAYFDKETNPGVGLFPLANTTEQYGTIVDNSDSTGTNSYEITISVMDEGVGQATEQCTLLMTNE